MTKKRSNATTKSKKTVKKKAYRQLNAAKIKLRNQAHYQNNAAKIKMLFKLHSLFKTKHDSEQANVLQNNAGVRAA